MHPLPAAGAADQTGEEVGAAPAGRGPRVPAAQILGRLEERPVHNGRRRPLRQKPRLLRDGNPGVHLVADYLLPALPEDAGFEAAFSSMSGEFRSDFPVSGDRGPSGRALYGDGRCKLEFATTSGSMVVARG